MKKKGFTLVELLAVIVILAIIALIAVPMILGVIEKTKKGAAKSSVIGFIDAVEKQIMMNQVDSDLENDILDGTYDVNENGELVITGKTPILVKVKGSIPTGTVKVENSKVVDYTLTVNGYTTTFEGNTSEEVVLHTLSGILKDENGSPLANTVVAVFSELKVTTTNENGKLTVTGLESGNYEIYVMPAGKTEEEVLLMTKEEIGTNSIAIGTYSTDTKEITFTTGNITFELENDTPVEEEPAIVEAESLSITNEEENLYVGDTLQLNVTVLPEETTDKSVTWETSDSEVATVDENGLVTGVGAGNVTITVKTSNNKDATKEISVSEKPVTAVSFAQDSWVTIQRAVNSGTYPYQVGDTKTVDMGDFGTHTVRVANTSDCTNGETSETACGFVVEFADIIKTYKMNSTSTNVGGWPASGMRDYLNSTIYNALPSDLKSIITDTTVVSGHGPTTGESNFTSIDKLYLLSAKEVWKGGIGLDGKRLDTAESETRQLEYYANYENEDGSKGVTVSNCSGAIKKNGENKASWWLRSARSNLADYFLGVQAVGYWTDGKAGYADGVSPAFRIE